MGEADAAALGEHLREQLSALKRRLPNVARLASTQQQRVLDGEDDDFAAEDEGKEFDILLETAMADVVVEQALDGVDGLASKLRETLGVGGKEASVSETHWTAAAATKDLRAALPPSTAELHRRAEQNATRADSRALRGVIWTLCSVRSLSVNVSVNVASAVANSKIARFTAIFEFPASFDFSRLYASRINSLFNQRAQGRGRLSIVFDQARRGRPEGPFDSRTSFDSGLTFPPEVPLNTRSSMPGSYSLLLREYVISIGQ